MVFFPLCYISTTLGSFPSSQQSFHTLFGLPTFTIEPWSPLLFSLSIEKMFSSLARQRSAKETQICQAPCSDHVQSVQSPLPEYL